MPGAPHAARLGRDPGRVPLGGSSLNAGGGRRPGARARRAALALLVVWVALVAASARAGPTGALSWRELAHGALAWLGAGEPLPGAEQAILRLRLLRALTAGGVGAALALSGAYLQGLYRNGLASPSVVGVTAGALFGGSLAIALVGGFGPGLALGARGPWAPLAVTGSAFAGALATSLFVLWLASRGGRLSVPTLLLAGIAANVFIAGALAALQQLTLHDYEVSRAILSWTFGTLDDRAGWQVALVWLALAVALLLIPFVGLELDLLAAGEEDASALGVRVQLVKLAVLLAASLATAAAVSVAGQIAFVGLVVPHLMRHLSGPEHRSLLPLSACGGAVFLLGCDWGQRALLGAWALQPGVLMSLIGGPFFLLLLLRQRRSLSTW